MDAATDMLVCPISGFCSGRVLTEDEVRQVDFVPGVQRPTVMHDGAFEPEARCAPCAGGGTAARQGRRRARAAVWDRQALTHSADSAGYDLDAPHFWDASQLAERLLGCAGRLARAFFDGYNCADVCELQQLW